MKKHRCYGCMNLTDQTICPICGWPEGGNNEAHQLPVGTILREQYLVGKVLGQGGFGITYLGWDLDLERPIAIKEFYPCTIVNRDVSHGISVQLYTANMESQYAASRERFLREAKALAKLTEVPEIVGIFNCFQGNNTAYIIMEYVKGTTLAQYVRMRGGRLGMDETLRILKPVMHALDTVHKAGLVHRDISPDNIILHPMGGAKILDFGAVRSVENPDVEKDLTKSTEAIVKQGFAPMEQYRNRGGIGPWTDEYALCGTIYYCLTGRIPPDALSRSMGEAEINWEGIPGLTETQCSALRKGMELISRNRYPTIGELSKALSSPQDPAGYTPNGAEPKVPIQRIGVMAASEDLSEILFNDKENQPFWGQTDYLRKDVDTISFHNTLDGVPENAWDVSAAKDRSILAWMNRRNLHVAGEGKIAPNPNASWMFASFTNLMQIDFGGCFTTSNVTDMSWMFFGCGTLTKIDLSCFDTSKTEHMRGMFSQCRSLRGLFFDKFDTSRVIDMGYMLYCCCNLESLDLSRFNTSRVRDMGYMFCSCCELISLNLSSFDASAVDNMKKIFHECRKLEHLESSDRTILRAYENR